ncbi:30S ribosomal protein S19 [Candidatus Pacearchaeota archaeon CG10_big_fil_rev_8_21_14_0_10_31_9]|nr:MAG: 30S ribosomal protein S19 [Candidatus Pacearchaeota archaeon CG1_02_32_21]PIN96742.1 MAG: 30S ribosomal protein S19 [Candidatus Pacearchaeota archaeon CG10_big_fil_rev_8_21_14_0_10_31_9]PIZ83519.1 MAG: 30S ribosomal protein S19 [Candidatus Pacearchaeota archaeon CG_4_10_14_0_2_um_filter_05_32_18]
MAEENIDVQRKREFLYRGKTIVDLQKMDIREFSKLLPSRERRTVLRNSDNIEKFLTKCRKRNDKKKPIKTHDRELVIVPEMVGLSIGVHNGKSFVKIDVIPEMIGHRLGEFALTRGIVKHGAAGIGATRSSASRSVK